MGTENETDKHTDLTEEEIAALADEEGGEGDSETATEQTTEETGGEKKPTETTDKTTEETDETDEGADVGQFASNEPAPVLRARAPEDADARLGALDDEATALETKFDDGDITASEYRKGLQAIEAKRSDIKWESQKAELAGEMQQQARENAWNETVRDFMTTDGATIAKSRAAMLAFDEFVKEVTSDQKNAKLTDRQQLEKAHKLFLADLGALGVAPAKKEAKGEQPQPKTPAPKRELPPTLARIPAAQIETTDDGKYAALDRLATSDPEAYEEAVAKMSPAEIEEFANAR